MSGRLAEHERSLYLAASSVTILAAPRASQMNTSTLILRMALFVLLGAPLVWVVWEAVNSLLSGRPGDVNWVLSIPAALLLAALLVLLGRSTPGMEDSRPD